MKPDTTLVETVPAPAPSNEPGTTTAPQPVNSSADVEQAKREAEQARIRANQLENENAKLKAAQEEAQRKQLEEKEEFKTLYEQTQAQLKEIQDTQASLDRQTELKVATEAVYKDYSPQAIELAKVAGLALSENSETAVASLKEKLEIFQKQVGSNPPAPTPNNPHQPAPSTVERGELVKRTHPGGESLMAMASARGDESVTLNYIRELPAIQRMKEIARNGA